MAYASTGEGATGVANSGNEGESHGRGAKSSLVRRADANENSRPRSFSPLICRKREAIFSFNQLRTGNTGIEGRQGEPGFSRHLHQIGVRGLGGGVCPGQERR